MGQLDGSFSIARNKIKKIRYWGLPVIILKTAKNALKFKPNYIAFGSFYKSRLKPKAIKANFLILKWSKKNIKNRLW